MEFETLRLAEPILRAVADEGYTAPTPIQRQAIPMVLAGHDLLGCAQTGTGKTGAFALPILHRLAASRNGAHGHRGRAPRVLVLCPTRELASQITESFKAYGRHLPLRCAVVFGGVTQNRQVAALRAGIDVLVATPGRLLDLMNQGFVDLRAIEALVLDEADRMLDMGFILDIRTVVAKLPKERQTLLFSATMPDEIRRLADSILRKPVCVQVDPVASTVETVAQSVYFVPRAQKPALLARLLSSGELDRTLVFTRTKRRADRVVRDLRRAGIRAEAIHGNKSQNARTRALDGFKAGARAVLVATDIASRGLDVDDISHVINFDIPDVPETYVHRIGRTARAGAAGTAVSFCDHEERADLVAIERLIRTRLQVRDDQPDLARSDAPTPAEPRPRQRAAATPHRRGPEPAPAPGPARSVLTRHRQPLSGRRRSSPRSSSRRSS